MELGLPMREALHNHKKRTEVPEPSNFVLTLTPADALRMPLGRVLKTSAATTSTKRPVKILFRLVRSTFPSTLLVPLGPAASAIGAAFG